MAVFGEIGRKFLEFLDPQVGGREIPIIDLPLNGENMEHHYLHSFLPYETFDPEKELFFNRSSVGFIFEISPLVGNSEEMQREITGLFQNTLPEGSSIQFMLWCL